MDTTWADNLKELDRLTSYRDELLKMLVDAENDLRNYRAALKAAASQQVGTAPLGNQR